MHLFAAIAEHCTKIKLTAQTRKKTLSLKPPGKMQIKYFPEHALDIGLGLDKRMRS